MNSLADAIVMQNLSVLTRGNTLRHKVLLLGGPNTYLPFLQDCWRKRIPETWDARGYDYPKDVPIEELIFVPKNAQYYAAYGAVMYGLYEAGRPSASTAASTGSTSSSPTAASRKLGETAGPPLVKDDDGARRVPRAVHASRASTRRSSSRAPRCAASSAWTAARRRRRPSSSTRHGEHPQEGVPALQGQPDPGHQGDPGAPEEVGHRPGRELEVIGFGATGYAADVLRGVGEVRRQHRRDRRAHDVGDALLRRHRRHLRHRRAGHQGAVHAERRHQELPPVEPVLGRQRHAAAGDGRSVRRPGHRVRRRRVRGQAVAQVQLRLRGVPRLRSRELPEGRLLEGGAARGPGAGAAEERLAVRRADPAHGGARARSSCCRAARSTTWPRSRRRSTTSRSAFPTPRSTSTRTAARPARSAPRSRRCAWSSGAGSSTFIGLDARDRPRVHVDQRREDALPLLPEQLRAHVHRHQDARRRDRALHLAASPARRARSSRKRRCSRSPRSARS